MLTGFAGYSGDRRVGVGGETVESGNAVGCRLRGIRVKGGRQGGCQACVCRSRGYGVVSS